MSGDRATLYDLKLFVDCCFRSPDSVHLTEGFDSAGARLERAGLIERNPQDRHEVRVSRGAGDNTAEYLVGQLAVISKRLTRQSKKRKMSSTR